MTHNELKKGMRVQLTPLPIISPMPRCGIIMDNTKSITRMVKIQEKNGYFRDIGSVYVNEILYYLDDTNLFEPVEVSKAHEKKLDTLTSIHWG